MMDSSIFETLDAYASSLTQGIKSFEPVVPKIYAYNTINYPPNNGWTKIGYTVQPVDKRVYQQTHTAGLQAKIAWTEKAQFRFGEKKYFKDYPFHDYLTDKKHIERRQGTEWFRIDGERSHSFFEEFVNGSDKDKGTSQYVLRKEQAEAVEKTMAYFKKGGEKFLWNAKPRFGKTLTSYDLIRKMGFEKVLVVTNRPAIAHSWAEDFFTFIGWQAPLDFISDSPIFQRKNNNNLPVMSRKTYLEKQMSGDENGFIAFESLQNLKGSTYFGGDFDKLEWISKLHFDLLIIDEAQEGIDTIRTEKAFEQITRDHTLYLSGTPFKALASNEFDGDQIYNWTYADEQQAKRDWDGDGYNPYEDLPKMEMFTYQMSPMIYDTISRGADITDDGDMVDFAFDLNEFFLTKANGTFIHEEEVKKFLHALSTQEKYPFSTDKLRRELSHTLWILNRVSSCKALEKLLREDPVFKDYTVIVAAGDGKTGDEDQDKLDMLERVKSAIKNNPKTITLSVGQLTVGVTVKPWSAVLMLCNLQSPSAYMQAAFRAQNPYEFTDKSGNRYRKETSYVFDFDPARTLIIFDQFANNLSPDTVNGRGTTEDRKRHIRQLLNFFPVIGEDSEGKMVELDAEKVLSIPRKLKCEEVVRKGFMSNFLFQNIGNVFGAPRAVLEILDKMTPALEESPNREIDTTTLEDIMVDENGEPIVDGKRTIGIATGIFGDKVYGDLGEEAQNAVDTFTQPQPVENISNKKEQKKRKDEFVKTITKQITDHIIKPVVDQVPISNSSQKKLVREVNREIETKINSIHSDLTMEKNIAQNEYEKTRKKLQDDVVNNRKTEEQARAETKKAEETYQIRVDDAQKKFSEATKAFIENTQQTMPQRVVDMAEKERLEDQKREQEGGIRDKLRGFSRTIPSFLMAYCDENLTLANLDDYTEDDVFEEVTGISEADFRLLRDGGTIKDPVTGEEKEFAGHLFDEVVFNDSVQQFLTKKKELANYFDESLKEDIFDYIPPQKTNQIFTPRSVVKKMVDELEKENPGCFDDPSNTFADLYMKSGLYITEIVKRLYRSEKMKKLYPDDRARIRHIIDHQVYGMAPTRIIYLIAINYILGFEGKNVKEENFPHFVQADAAEASKEGRLQQLVDEKFGK